MKRQSKTLVTLALLTSTLTAGCGVFEQEKKKSSKPRKQNDIVTPIHECEEDSKIICREESDGVYTKISISRTGKTCEFETFTDEVEMEFCDSDGDVPPVVEPIERAEPSVLDPQFINPTPDLKVVFGEVVDIHFAATDPRSDFSHYAISGAPEDAHFDASTGQFSWTASGQPEIYEIKVEAIYSDGSIEVTTKLVASKTLEADCLDADTEYWDESLLACLPTWKVGQVHSGENIEKILGNGLKLVQTELDNGLYKIVISNYIDNNIVFTIETETDFFDVSPDGKYVAYLSGLDNQEELQVLSLETSKAVFRTKDWDWRDPEFEFVSNDLFTYLGVSNNELVRMHLDLHTLELKEYHYSDGFSYHLLPTGTVFVLPRVSSSVGTFDEDFNLKFCDKFRFERAELIDISKNSPHIIVEAGGLLRKNALLVLNPEKCKVVFEIHPESQKAYYAIQHVQFAPNGKSIFILTSEGEVIERDLESGNILRSFYNRSQYKGQFAREIEFSPDGRFLLLKGETNVGRQFVQIKDIETLLVERVLAGFEHFTPDGTQLLTREGDNAYIFSIP